MNLKNTHPLRTVLTLPSEGNSLTRNCQTLLINPHGLEAPSEPLTAVLRPLSGTGSSGIISSEVAA